MLGLRVRRPVTRRGEPDDDASAPLAIPALGAREVVASGSSRRAVPFLTDLTNDELLALLAECADHGEGLRGEGAEVLIVIGSELRLMNKGFVAGETFLDRSKVFAEQGPRLHEWLAALPGPYERVPRQGRRGGPRATRRQGQLRLAPVRGRRLDAVRLHQHRSRLPVRADRRPVPRAHPPLRRPGQSPGQARSDHRVRLRDLQGRGRRRPAWRRHHRVVGRGDCDAARAERRVRARRGRAGDLPARGARDLRRGGRRRRVRARLRPLRPAARP